MKIKYKIYIVFLLSLFWIVLSGHYNLLMLFFGFSSCICALYFSDKMGLFDFEEKNSPIIITPKFIAYCAWLLKEVIISTIKLCRELVKFNPKISPALKWIKHSQKTDGLIAVYGNSITLTPGTICVETTKEKMLVHAILVENIDDLQQGEMDKKVKNSVL